MAMIKLFPAAAVIVGGLAFAAPAHAQAKDQTLIIYGNDRCPANTICVRRSEGERYRIPRDLRDGTLDAANQPWAARASSVSRAGAATGIGSCSNVGPGGSTGCTQQMLKQAREERRQKAAEKAASSEPTEVGTSTVR
jgi:hypothetical protein